MLKDGSEYPACGVEALKLLDHGFVPVPADALGKKPRVRLIGDYFQAQVRDREFHRTRWEKHPEDGLGLLLNGLLLIDPDTDEAVAAVEAWMVSSGLVCPMQVTPGGGRHYLAALDEPLQTRSGRSLLVPGLDWKCGNTLIEMLAPTVGSNGTPYRWAAGRSIYEIAPPLLSADQIASLEVDLGIGRKKSRLQASGSLGGSKLTEDGLVPVGERHNELVVLSGSLRRGNRSKDEARILLRSFRDGMCESGDDIDHVVDDEEIEHILDWNFDSPAPPWLYSPNQNKFVADVTDNSSEAVVLHTLINMADMRGRIEINGARQGTIRSLCNIGTTGLQRSIKALRDRGRITMITRNDNYYNKKMKNEETSTIYIIHYEDWL